MFNFSRESPHILQIMIIPRQTTGLLLTLMLLYTATAVFAHGGHGDEFHSTDTDNLAPESIQVDQETAQRLGLKIEPVTEKPLQISIKTTGQIETLPSKKVEVTNPIPGKVKEILVEPGADVKAGQPVVILASAELVELRVTAQEKQLEALANLKKAQADLKLAQENLARQQKIAAAEIAQAETEVTIAQEKYQRDLELAEQGAIPRRTLWESEAHLLDGKAQLAKAVNQQEVIKAENEIQLATVAVESAQSHLQLSNVTYQTRLQQLGTIANEQGLVIITAPIAGQVADREVTLGQAFEDAGTKLMTIVNDKRVFVTANVYEKDLARIKLGQPVNVQVANLANRTFRGKISQIGSVVGEENRVVSVKAELDNSDGELKPGLFAELEIVTEQTSNPMLVIPHSAVVEANGKNLVYLQNGNAFEAVEVTLGQTNGDFVAVITGLFAGDLIVTQRAPQLYAQSLRGGSKKDTSAEAITDENQTNSLAKFSFSQLRETSIPNWLLTIAGGGAIALTAFAAGAFWSRHRPHFPLLTQNNSEYNQFPQPVEDYFHNNHQDTTLNNEIDNAVDTEAERSSTTPTH